MLRNKLTVTKRTKLHSEGELCDYPHRVCMQNRLDGYEYCIKHILEDKSAPYRQCNYIYPKNGKRCPSAASKLERKDGYCHDHARRGVLLRQRAVRKKRPPESLESLIEELEHYNVIHDYRDLGDDISKEFNTQALVRLPLTAPVNRISRIIDYASDSDSDVEPMKIDQSWKGNADSDAESVDSEQDDPLKHAGVYTADEATLITRDKLIRLQSLYIEQFKRLQHVLKEKRRRYLHALKQEKETQGNLHSSSRPTPMEVEQYKKLKALLRYHRLHGVELILHHKSKERGRLVSEGANFKPAPFTKCSYHDRDKKCGQRALPYTKYCVKHILFDPHQVLYRPCSAQDGSCCNPVVPVVDMGACVFHYTLPPLPPPVPRENPMSQPQTSSQNIGDQLDPLTQHSDDMCSLQSSDFGLSAPADINCSLYGDSASNGSMGYMGSLTTAKELWATHLDTPESKLREELEAIDLTPGELPPEQLLATN